ncbi:hypothetical protein D9619_004431 [Psilocybe cf. subviscida]|uniref:F-box domain-containing protein n=1 Tax=Psilocybe cf. subviscida TaxID=2480587 RepID=A0A8H5F7S7_9AGAR|nr:hypothetical protein D9619_004431 [Psilocybe cf. subviscida]
MAPEPPVIRASPRLPNELYREIAENLHHYGERYALLCLALVCKAWRAESQRVLFRTVCDDSTDLSKREGLIRTHTLFLKSIIANPARLGPYVRTYKQRDLICYLFFRAGSELSSPGASSVSHVWDLTARALPALINLKHLFIVPLRDGRRTARAYLLEGCTFKLESLSWGFAPYDSTGSDSIADLLRTQHDLFHLEDGPEPSRQDFSWMPDDVFTSLISTTCRLKSAPRIMAKRRKIVGLRIWSDWNPRYADPQNHLSALRPLKYLSISAHRGLMSHWGAIDSHVVLLELVSWDLRTIQNLSGLSNLRVSALVRAAREASLSRFLGDEPMDVNAEPNLRMQLTVESSHRCPNLEYVIIQDIPRGETRRQYRKLSLAPANIQDEEFFIENEMIGMPWWTVYGV